MRLLFVKADKIGSKIIRWGLSEPASHVAVEFETSDLVYHSYVIGIRAATKRHFHETYDVVSSVRFNLSPTEDRECFNDFFDSIPDKQNYDYPALIYFGWRAFLKKYFNRDFPRFNDWQKTEGFLCTEATYLLADVLARRLGIMILPEDKDLAMVTPSQLYTLLCDKIKAENLPFSYASEE